MWECCTWKLQANDWHGKVCHSICRFFRLRASSLKFNFPITSCICRFTAKLTLWMNEKLIENLTWNEVDNDTIEFLKLCRMIARAFMRLFPNELFRWNWCIFKLKLIQLYVKKWTFILWTFTVQKSPLKQTNLKIFFNLNVNLIQIQLSFLLSSKFKIP